jgi:hypothetical protein
LGWATDVCGIPAVVVAGAVDQLSRRLCDVLPCQWGWGANRLFRVRWWRAFMIAADARVSGSDPVV